MQGRIGLFSSSRIEASISWICQPKVYCQILGTIFYRLLLDLLLFLNCIVNLGGNESWEVMEERAKEVEEMNGKISASIKAW